MAARATVPATRFRSTTYRAHAVLGFEKRRIRLGGHSSLLEVIGATRRPSSVGITCVPLPLVIGTAPSALPSAREITHWFLNAACRTDLDRSWNFGSIPVTPRANLRARIFERSASAIADHQ